MPPKTPPTIPPMRPALLFFFGFEIKPITGEALLLVLEVAIDWVNKRSYG